MEKTTKPGVSKAQYVAGALIIIAIAVAAVAVGVAVLVFGAYGCGKLFARWLPFSPFEATVVSLLALVTTVGLAAKLLSRVFASQRPRTSYLESCAVCGRYHDVEDHEACEDEDLEEDLALNDGLRAALFASGAVKPNAPCPCGSGSRYGKCCGDGRLFRQRRVGTRAG
jgi:hypothetical protein